MQAIRAQSASGHARGLPPRGNHAVESLAHCNRRADCAARLRATRATGAIAAGDPQDGGGLRERARFSGERITGAANVLVAGNTIRTISAAPITDAPEAVVTHIAGGERTLMPGLIDAHTHVMFATVPQLAIADPEKNFVVIMKDGRRYKNRLR